jgi:NADH-quinone oxidoreductase subunit M
MILTWFIIILITGGILAKIAEYWNPWIPKWIALIVSLIALSVAASLWISNYAVLQTSHSAWLITYILPWIPQFGISFHLAMDGLSLLMLMLTYFLGTLAVLTSWKEIKYKVGFFYLNILWVLAGITGVFLAMDLFLFYFFWEVMLIPMFFLIAIWGHENRRYAAYKFFIFTQASGLLMLLAILGLYFIHGSNTDIYTFDYFQLLGTSLSTSTGRWLMLGFLAAFIVKLPAVPFHSWLPDAHSEAPTAGSLILAGLLLKTGAYGLIRFVIPLFPDASAELAPWMMALGVIGILYGAMLAFAQTDLKRLVAYTSVSHMGFILLGVFAFNTLAMQGVVMQMITHGISTGALFILAGSLYERIHTRDIMKMGGFWSKAPYMGTIGLIFAMASLGLPGLGNFVAEFLTLVGAWQSAPLLTILATTGLIAATAYSLRIVQKVFLGNHQPGLILPDLSYRERIMLIPMVIVILWLGVFPKAVLKTSEKACVEAEQAIMHNLTSSAIGDKSTKVTVATHQKGGTHE